MPALPAFVLRCAFHLTHGLVGKVKQWQGDSTKVERQSFLHDHFGLGPKEANCCHINTKEDPDYEHFKATTSLRFERQSTFESSAPLDAEADPSDQVPGWEVGYSDCCAWFVWFVFLFWWFGRKGTSDKSGNDL